MKNASTSTQVFHHCTIDLRCSVKEFRNAHPIEAMRNHSRASHLPELCQCSWFESFWSSVKWYRARIINGKACTHLAAWRWRKGKDERGDGKSKTKPGSLVERTAKYPKPESRRPHHRISGWDTLISNHHQFIFDPVVVSSREAAQGKNRQRKKTIVNKINNWKNSRSRTTKT